MELRRFEALTNLSQSGVTKVIFDLAKPFDDHSASAARKVAATMAEASNDLPPQRRLNPAQLQAEAEYEARAVAEADAAMKQTLKR
jgi:hypothetical protein